VDFSSTDAIITNSKQPANGQKKAASQGRHAIRALLVGNRDIFLEGLGYALECLGIKAGQAAGCCEVPEFIRKPAPPDIIFANTNLPDGNWKDVRRMATTASRTVPVVDIHLYLNALEGGAVDFIVPPFQPPDLAFVIESALQGGGSKRRPTA